MFRTKSILFIFFTTLTMQVVGQTHFTDSLSVYVKEHPVISTGGAEPIIFNNKAFIVGVGAVEIKGQPRSALERMGKMRAEKEVSTLINGSDFTSSVKMVISQTTTNVNNTTNQSESIEYLETIAENSEGFIRLMKQLTTWKSDDGAMFYFAIYKPIKRDILQ
jgi:hypothetical protein